VYGRPYLRAGGLGRCGNRRHGLDAASRQHRQLRILSARETYVALLIAFVLITISILPSMIYMYRPDVFTDAPLLRAVFVFPMNLVWYPDFAAYWGLPLAGLFLGFAFVFAAASGWRIKQGDVL
jgi:hypothetical protein